MNNLTRRSAMCAALVPLASTGGWTALASRAARAETWPTKPVKMIVTQAAGGTPDIICRSIGVRPSRPPGQQIVVENRPGATNTIGVQAAARPRRTATASCSPPRPRS